MMMMMIAMTMAMMIIIVNNNNNNNKSFISSHKTVTILHNYKSMIYYQYHTNYVFQYLKYWPNKMSYRYIE